MKVQHIRWFILGIILICIMVLQYLHITAGNIYPSVHAVCPLGGLENLQIWLAGHANLQKIFSGTMTLFFFSLGFTLLFGRAICGNICPFGALGEFAGLVSPLQKTLPKKLDRGLRYLKYIILILVVGMAWYTTSLWISPYDPYVAFAHIWQGTRILHENGIGLLILIAVLVFSLIVRRFFCRYLCPAGAMFALVSLAGLTRVTRTGCMACGRCIQNCPMGIEPGKNTLLNKAECIGCTTCVAGCPSEHPVLSMKIASTEIKPLFFILGTVSIFFGVLALLSMIGLMQVAIPPLESVQQGGAHLNLIDLRGSMTIQEGAAYAGMNLTEFYSVMEIPDTVPADTRLNQVRNYVPGYDFHAMKAK